MTESYGYDKTPTPPIDYDVSKVPAEIRKRTDWVKSKFTGEDVAEAYRQAGDIAGIYAGEAKRIAERTQIRQDAVEDFNNQVIQEMTDKDIISAPEIIQARDGEETLKNRLLRDSNTIQAIDATLDAFAKKINFKRISVLDFGAVGDGVTDDTQAFLSAIAYAESLKDDDTLNRWLVGVKISAPTGVFLVTSDLIITKSNIVIEGEGFSATVIYKPNSTTDGIVFDGSQKALYGSSLNNLRVYSPGNSTSGVAVRFINVINSINNNVEISGAYEGLEVDGGGKVYFNQWLINQTNRTPGTPLSYQLKVLGETGLPGDIHFTDLQISPNYLSIVYSVLIRASDGLYFTNCHTHGGWMIDPRGSGYEKTLASIFWNNVYFDNSSDALIKFSGTADAYRNFFLTNCYIRGGLNGIITNTTSPMSMLILKGSKISGMTQHGIRMDNANSKDFSIGDSIFADNNTSNSVDGTDILVRGNAHMITNTTHTNTGQRTGILINFGSASSGCLADNIMGINSNLATRKVTDNGTNNIVGRVIPSQA